jgi:hypothetical protein
MSIPLKIWQTWETKELPPKMNECVNKLKSQHPNFEHHLYDANDRYEFIKNNFPYEVVLAYEALIPGAYKADLWRYCILYIHGGIYIDIKMEFMDKYTLFNFIDKEYLTFDGDILIDNKKYCSICNGFMILKKNNINILKCILNIVSNVSKLFYGSTPWDITGPRLVGRNFLIKLYSDDIELYFSKESIIKTCKGNHNVLKFYDDYNLDRKKDNNYYVNLWNKKLVFDISKQKILSEIYDNNTMSDDFNKLLSIFSI